MNDKKIKIVENGPYIVSGDIPLSRENSVPDQDNIPEKWEKDRELPVENNICFADVVSQKTNRFVNRVIRKKVFTAQNRLKIFHLTSRLRLMTVQSFRYKMRRAFVPARVFATEEIGLGH